jgi:hypothetical protein
MCVHENRSLAVVLSVLLGLVAGSSYSSATDRVVRRSENRRLSSLREAAEAAMRSRPRLMPGVREIPNFRGVPADFGENIIGGDPDRQIAVGLGLPAVQSSFEGTDNEANLQALGFRVAPPDTDADVGPQHVVQMINLLTTVFSPMGDVLVGPFASNAFWAGVGGNCEPFNAGDPIVLYDETNDRWLVSQFAFDSGFTTFSQCIAVSTSGDPVGGYNRYEFSFDGIGLPDYPKHGLVTDSVSMTANLFVPPLLTFGGSLLAAIDKDAMYNGQTATLVGFILRRREFGFLPADLDDPDGSASPTPALFATAISRRRRFDVWQIDVDWNNPDGATASRIDAIFIPPVDADLCEASREACIPQPGAAPALEAIPGRLMHRLQVRDFGTHKSMVAAHTIDADGQGTAGIRWYEMRQGMGSTDWAKHQIGTYAPDDGIHRWMPSIAMNAAGDIGMGFLVSSGTEAMGTRLTGQTSGASGSGTMDAGETICRAGDAAQAGTARSGDYSATSVDPVTDSFWHTNEYGQMLAKTAAWGTFVCEFTLPAP